MTHTKNLSQIIALVLIVILSSCTDEGVELVDGNQVLPNVASKVNVKKINADITIDPSGDLSGVSDADNIQVALDNLTPGGTILLESGTYYISRTIVAPSGFSGTLQGSGKDNTEIVGVGDDLVPFLNEQIYNPSSPFLIEGSSFFFFPDLTGSVTVSNFSASLPDGFATQDNDLESKNLVAFITVNLAGDGAGTHFDNLRLTGTTAHPDGPDWYFSQPVWGIQVLGDRDPGDFPIPSNEGGTHTITNSEISKMGVQATVHETLKNATIEISGNSYSEIKQTIYKWLDGCNVSVTNNSMETISWGAIVVTQEGFLIPGALNSVVISGNNVSTSGYMPIEIGPIPDGGASFMLLIEKNKLTNEGPDPLGWFTNFAGIGIFNGNDEAVVRNNIIRGEAGFGILQESNGGTFVGNNLQGINALDAGYGLFGDYNTVVGKGNSTVIDGGVDNIITGLTKVEGESIGDRIKEAQAKRKEILDALNDL